MALPPGVITRPWLVRNAYNEITGDAYTTQIQVTPDRSLVWAATGAPAIATTVVLPPDFTDSIAVPVTDQDGYRTPGGDPISVANGAQSHLYNVVVSYFDPVSGKQVGKPVTLNGFANPQGDGSTIDLSLAIPSSDPVTGVTITIPDEQTQLIAQAQAAAQQALQAAQQAANSAAIAGSFANMAAVDQNADGTWPDRPQAYAVFARSYPGLTTPPDWLAVLADTFTMRSA